MKLLTVSLAVATSLILSQQTWAGNLVLNGNLSVNSNVTVGGQITTTNTTSIGNAGTVAISTLGGSTNIFGINLASSNASPRIQFHAAGDEGGGFHFYSNNRGHLGDMWVRSEDQWLQSNVGPGFRVEGAIEAYGGLSAPLPWANPGLYVAGDATIDGKLNLSGTPDPPCLLLDAETRDSIAQRIARDVPPSKQTGAALFWNKETKQLEVYVASEGAFYDLAGKIITTIKPPTIPDSKVTKSYRIDPATGSVLAQESMHAPSWQLKAGYKFDRLTGVFTFVGTESNAVPAVVGSQEALELK
jgi:hypothetical protein